MADRRRFLKQLFLASAGLSAAGPLEATLARLGSALPGITLGDRSDPAIRALRAEYMLSPDILYLNHASIGTVPRAVHEAHVAALELCESNPWLYMWGGEWDAPRELAREALAELLGAPATSVAITHNTTEGFNQLANGLDLGAGDEVLFTSLNHDGAAVCWEMAAEAKGFSVREATYPVAEAPEMTGADVVAWHLEQIRPETRVLVFPHVDNRIGVRHPLREIADGAHARGVEVVAVDGAQTAGMIPCDLEASGVDAFAGSPHKWIQSPKGLGVFYLRESLQQRLRPSWVTWGQRSWSGSARRFEDYGTRNLAAVVALGEALVVQQTLEADGKAARYRDIHARLQNAVAGTPGLHWRSPRSWEDGASLVAIEVEGRAAPELGAELLRDHGVILRSFGADPNALRISPNVITTDAELDHLVDLLTAARR